jgi:23S rRNA (cytosine1962-C5)-methyltransferase
MNRVVLKKDRDWVLEQGHPWVYADSVELRPEVSLKAGEVVEVVSSKGDFVGKAFYNAQSAIALRVLTKKNMVINEAYFRTKLLQAFDRRKKWWSEENQILRMVAFEGDGLPGLVIDRYGDWWIFQILCAGMENYRATILSVLKEVGAKGVVERSDEAVREKEGLALRKELCWGEFPEHCIAKENGIAYHINLWDGHKTGFYIDQRDNRRKLGALGEKGRVLNCFCYTGGFSCALVKNGARQVVSVDSSLPALEKLEANYALNHIDPEQHQQIQGDVFEVLKHLPPDELFDGIILDPPKFAGRKQHLRNALKAYTELNVLGLRLLKPGGWLATFTCSGRVTRSDFQKALEDAARESGCSWVIEDWLSQAPDHTVLNHFPESLYLKGLLVRKLSDFGC